MLGNFKNSKNWAAKLSLIILCVFFAGAVIKSSISMYTSPFHDFDEANRAEGAKQMQKHNSYLFPVTGSPYLRVEGLQIPYTEGKHLDVYHHLERPPLVYWAMIVSTSLFGEKEWAYRLPSFMFGLGGFILFFWVIRKLDRNISVLGLIVSFAVFVCSIDWWLSAQFALLDTALSFFLFLSVGSLLIYIRTHKPIWLIMTSIALSGAILSKGQPAAIFLFPAITALFLKALSLRQFFQIFFVSGLILSPWLIAASIQFGVENVIQVFVFGFAKSRVMDIEPTQQAPVFWYARWWWGTFKPGWTLFGSLVMYDILTKRIDLTRVMLLAYIGGSFLLLSVVSNKVWWYVLPLVPAVSLYLYLSLKDYFLRQKDYAIFPVSLILIIASLPFFRESSNTVAMLFGFVQVAISIILLLFPYYKSSLLQPLYASQRYLYVLAVTIMLLSCALYFPSIEPTYHETKDVGRYYADFSQPKCLWVEGMPYEAALYYSDAGEITYLDKRSEKRENSCTEYLITPIFHENYERVFQKGEISLYRL